MATSRAFFLRQVNNLKRKVGKYYTKKKLQPHEVTKDITR